MGSLVPCQAVQQWPRHPRPVSCIHTHKLLLLPPPRWILSIPPLRAVQTAYRYHQAEKRMSALIAEEEEAQAAEDERAAARAAADKERRNKKKERQKV